MTTTPVAYDLTALVKEIREHAEKSSTVAASLMAAAAVTQQNTRFLTELADMLEPR